MPSRRQDQRFARACILLALLVTLAFRAFAPAARGAAQDEAPVALELVQTVPTGTALGLPDLRPTHEVWRAMIDGARARVELAHFYASERPSAHEGSAPSRLGPIVQALERAAERGVEVRFLADEGFHATYPETLDRLDARDRIEVRLYDLDALTGGALHAKYMLVDGREGFVGSQNFDWRSLEHIQELGVRFTGAPLVQAFSELFERDWRQAASPQRLPAEEWSVPGALALPAEAQGGERVTPVYSPEGLLPRADLWDLPRLQALIAGAEQKVRLQFLGFSARLGAEPWDGLEAPLRAAAARGVEVELLLSHWATRKSSLAGLRALDALDRVSVRFLTVPEGEEGFLPYARVAHAKLIAVDGGRAGWIGTSNGSGDYFEESRNAGFVIEGGQVPLQLDRFFEIGWSSPHAAPVDPARAYPEPRVGE